MTANADPAPAPVVDLEHVSFAYGEQPAVDDVSLTVEAGDFLGLIGPNGSGKTTLLRIMLGLLSPDSGSVELFGQPVEEFEQGERIGYVSQQATSGGGTMPVTVRECVRMGRFAHVGHSRLTDEDRAIADEALETVGITDLADQQLNQLSGGQRQRAYIARALASEADLLALDEPTVGVDAESRDAFYQLLESLNNEGITIILIEHDIGVVTDRADRIACINTELYHHGDTESFVESDALSEAYGATGTVVHHHH
ncbi:metal ABC transporter ATP-binding protein [Halopiger aswanensis]|uniref:Cobalamin import ATP-binding protein BtuD n=1 Tax=Halopiger aswanensis TaxID=148449 RepID=A0A419WP64_9EURY|nr:metal ABC transporter ATP-binding protein [Halopiger aswanensis]RKD97194.1 zinc transport system ATP-binding protein [Halopiger aswanensis]